MEQSSHAAYLRSLQTADDVEGCVGILVHLEEGRRKEIRTSGMMYKKGAILVCTELIYS